MFDAELYRSKEEVAQWKERDPITLFTSLLLEHKLVTADEIEAGSNAVSALFPGRHGAFRLIDATGDPLGCDNEPEGPFEANGVADLLAGMPVVQQTIGHRLRTLVPLTNDMHPNCATCHLNYDALPAGTVVGAASLRIKF